MASYKKEICDAKGGAHFFGPGMTDRNCRGPFQDLLGSLPTQTFDMVNYRNLLLPDQIFGTRSCRRGYEGTVNETFDRYMTCHQLIFIPTSFEAWTLSWLIVISIVTVVVVVTYLYIRRKMKRKYLMAKIERRRSRRSSEESARNSQQTDAVKAA